MVINPKSLLKVLSVISPKDKNDLNKRYETSLFLFVHLNLFFSLQSDDVVTENKSQLFVLFIISSLSLAYIYSGFSKTCGG